VWQYSQVVQTEESLLAYVGTNVIKYITPSPGLNSYPLLRYTLINSNTLRRYILLKGKHIIFEFFFQSRQVSLPHPVSCWDRSGSASCPFAYFCITVFQLPNTLWVLSTGYRGRTSVLGLPDTRISGLNPAGGRHVCLCRRFRCFVREEHRALGSPTSLCWITG
jgi:hypothetical protein